MTGSLLLLDASTPSSWLATHLSARYDAHSEGGAVPSTSDGDGWLDRAALLADDAMVLRTVHQRLVDRDRVPAPAAAIYLAEWTAGTVADAVGFALATASAGFVVDADSVRWHQHAEGWMDRVELGEPAVVVAPGHPWAGQSGVEVAADSSAVVARAVDALVDAVSPLVDACHSLARVGRAGLWNEVADGLGMAVAFQALLPARPDVVETLQVAVRVPGVPWKAKPQLHIVDGPIGSFYVAQKGGCCLAYTRPPEDRVDEDGEPDAATVTYRARFPEEPGQPRYCSTCSFRDAADCEARQVFWLERELAAADDDDKASDR